MTNRLSVRTVCATLILAGAASSASAVPITFIHTGVDGSGSIGGVEFIRKDITITAVGDTDSLDDFGILLSIDHITASIEIEGVGTFDIQSPTRTYADSVSSSAGFAAGTDGFGRWLLGSGNDASLETWDMLSSIGPVSGDGTFEQWDQLPAVDTSGGVLKFSDNSGLGSTFQAIVVPAPAPLGAIAMTGVFIARRRR